MLDIAYVSQKPDFCGEAVVQMVTTYFGRPVSQTKVHEAAGLKKVKRGAYGSDMFLAIRNLGLKTNPESTMDWHYVTEDEVSCPLVPHRPRQPLFSRSPGRYGATVATIADASPKVMEEEPTVVGANGPRGGD